MGKHQEFIELTKERKKVLSRESDKVVGYFDAMHDEVCKDGVISFKYKALAAVGMSIAIRCMQCLTHHVNFAVEQGVSRAELVEIIELAILMGGGPSTSYGAIALEIYDELKAEQA